MSSSRLGILAAALLVVGTLACRKAAPVRSRSAPDGPGEAPPTQTIVLFFADGEGRLQRESREVPELPQAEPARIRIVLEELLLGSRQGLLAPFPWGVGVKTVFVDNRGTAYVDLEPAPPPGVVTGTNAEVTLAYATVNTVVANTHGIVRVQLLFSGKEVETFGHLDLSHPLVPQAALVAP